jgi:hypothetical protein
MEKRKELKTTQFVREFLPVPFLVQSFPMFQIPNRESARSITSSEAKSVPPAERVSTSQRRKRRAS